VTEETRAPAGVLDGGLLAVAGLEALREIHAGRAPQPPIHDWSGRRLVGLQRGEASIAMPASGWFCGPKGRLHSGIFAFLLDMAHLYAVLSTLPAGGGCTTAELSVTVLGEPPPSGAEITARSRVIYSDERNALTEGLVTGQAGQPLAHSTSRYFVFAPGTVAPARSGSGSLAGMRLTGPGARLEEPVPQLAPIGPRCSSSSAGFRSSRPSSPGRYRRRPLTGMRASG
jgi:acyl-coenzyme A thioesterase PaaI-like protein